MVLFSYDEILGCVISGGTRRIDAKKRAYLLFVSCLLNLYFLSFALMESSFKNKIYSSAQFIFFKTS